MRLIVTILTGLIFLSCQQTRKLETSKEEKSHLILISLDGFRWDYVERFQPPHLLDFIQEGVKAESLKPVFPSKTFPNHYSIATGMYPENHGLVGNSFYSPQKKATYRIRDREKVTDGTWYGGTPIWVQAAKSGINTASYFFVGSEADVQGIRPNYYYDYQHNTPNEMRVAQIIDWLQMPEKKRPRLITAYFSDMDDIGHRVGPNNDAILKEAMLKLDQDLGNLFQQVAKLDLPVNIIIVSDHGMAAVTKEQLLYIESIENKEKYRTVSNGPFVNIYLNDKQDKQKVFQELRKKAAHFEVFDTQDMPYYTDNPSHPNIGDLLIVTTFPYYFKPTWGIRSMKSAEIGEHGYDPIHRDLHGIFYAKGPVIKKGLTIPTFENIHIYPIMCEILNINIPKEVDGNISVLKEILK